jgi:hypothetical protein
VVTWLLGLSQIRGKEESLAEEANNLFGMVWQGMANSDISRYIRSTDSPEHQGET